MQRSFSRDLLFFRIVLGLFILIGGLFVLWFGYKESFLLAHHVRLPFLDTLMPHLTHLGTGTIVSAVFALWLLPREKALILSMWCALLMVMVIIYVLKWTLFKDWDRPGLVFKMREIHFITLERIFNHSFPSGHSAASAAEWTIIAVILARYRSWMGGLAALAAIVIG
ncbi:MAG: phosphatase PAP2 family protein [Bacteroidota bacterium]